MLKKPKTASSSGLYVELKLHPTSFGGVLKRLRKVVNDNIDHDVIKLVEPHALHVTGIYSPDKNVHIREQKRNSKPAVIHEAVVKAVSMFGKDNDTLVLELESESLDNLHKKWLDLGAEPTFPEYKPHITIALPPCKVSKKFKEDLMEAFDGYTLKLYREQCQPIH